MVKEHLTPACSLRHQEDTFRGGLIVLSVASCSEEGLVLAVPLDSQGRRVAQPWLLTGWQKRRVFGQRRSSPWSRSATSAAGHESRLPQLPPARALIPLFLCSVGNCRCRRHLPALLAASNVQNEFVLYSARGTVR
ncbi:hypothetical protein MTO96_010460 [Rhipicephalus appendiculatus]